MQYCPLCQVKVVGDKCACPLCKGQLVGEPEPEHEIFPPVIPPQKRARIAQRIITLCVLVVIAACIQVETVWRPVTGWPIFVMAASVCSWLAVMLGISRRRMLMQNLAAQTMLFCVLSVCWDIGTGWRAWSIDWIIPILCLGGLGALWILKLVLHVPMVEAVGWIGTICLIGWLVPFLLLLLDKVNVVLPSMICASVSFLVLVLLLIFFHRSMKEEAERRFHL